MEVRIIQINKGTDKDWAVRIKNDAQPVEYETLFEGEYEACWHYVHEMAVDAGEESINVIFSGSRNNVRLWQVLVVYEIDPPTFNYPEYTDPKIIERLHNLIDC